MITVAFLHENIFQIGMGELQDLAQGLNVLRLLLLLDVKGVQLCTIVTSLALNSIMILIALAAGLGG